MKYLRNLLLVGLVFLFFVVVSIVYLGGWEKTKLFLLGNSESTTKQIEDVPVVIFSEFDNVEVESENKELLLNYLRIAGFNNGFYYSSNENSVMDLFYDNYASNNLDSIRVVLTNNQQLLHPTYTDKDKRTLLNSFGVSFDGKKLIIKIMINEGYLLSKYEIEEFNEFLNEKVYHFLKRTADYKLDNSKSETFAKEYMKDNGYIINVVLKNVQ